MHDHAELVQIFTVHVISCGLEHKHTVMTCDCMYLHGIYYGSRRHSSLDLWLWLSPVEDRLPIRGDGSGVREGIRPEVLAGQCCAQRHSQSSELLIATRLLC